MFELILVALIIVLSVILFLAILKIFEMKEDILALKHLKRSQSVKYGQLTEQWIPFSDKFPFNPQNFRFIGKPIDGVSFEDDKIVFVEFKTNTSSLSQVQKEIKDLIKEKKVEWFELKIK
jgi:predicted Holliday junction resolvase-like endonuclease